MHIRIPISSKSAITLDNNVALTVPSLDDRIYTPAGAFPR